MLGGADLTVTLGVDCPCPKGHTRGGRMAFPATGMEQERALGVDRRSQLRCQAILCGGNLKTESRTQADLWGAARPTAAGNKKMSARVKARAVSTQQAHVLRVVALVQELPFTGGSFVPQGDGHSRLGAKRFHSLRFHFVLKISVASLGNRGPADLAPPPSYLSGQSVANGSL